MSLSYKLEVSGASDAELATGIAALNARLNGTTAPGGGTGGAGVPDPKDPNNWDAATVQAKFFPTDFATAAFPSPERSQIVIDPDGTWHGAPYIMDAQGKAWTFPKDSAGKPILGPTPPRPPRGFLATLNGVQLSSTLGILGLIVAQGQVYFTVAPGGQIQKFAAQDVPGSGTQNVNLPPFWQDPFYGYKQSHGIGTPAGGGTGGTGGGTGGVAIPPNPPAQAVPYGSTGKTILFGPDQTLKTIKAALTGAVAGDVVKASDAARGTVFAESFDIPEAVVLDLNAPGWTDAAALDALFAVPGKVDRAALMALWKEGAIVDGTALDPALYSHGLGGVIFNGNGKVINGHVKGFGMKAATHDGTAGLRARGNCVGQIQGKNLFIEGCQNGIGPGGSQIISGPWVQTVIVDCGIDDGGAHNVYDSSATVQSLIGPGFYSDSSPMPKEGAGHAYKTRAGASVTMVAPSVLKGSDSSAFDIPNGTAGVCNIGGTIEQIAGAANHTLLGYGAEGPINGTGGVKLKAKLIANCSNPNILANGPVDCAGSTVTGGKIASTGSVPVANIP